MSCLISVVSVVGMSSLFVIDANRADPMPSKNERQGQSTNIFFFHDGSLQGHTSTEDKRMAVPDHDTSPQGHEAKGVMFWKVPLGKLVLPTHKPHHWR